MKDLATQVYIAYLHQMIAAHEDIKEKQDTMIKLLEDQVKDLMLSVEIYRESHEALKSLVSAKPEKLEKKTRLE